ncbi:MAG: hypothetical protein ACKO5K_00640, partial [Armatimonadota bacterium]
MSTPFADRPLVRLRTEHAEAVFDLGGGSLVDFHATGSVNPLGWLAPDDRDAANRPMAHFLCCDRWGQPSPGEQAAGMPFHGEATRVKWQLGSGPGRERIMGATLPMAGMEIQRRARLADGAAVLRVDETFRNVQTLGKIHNVVQHPTLGPPFLDTETVVDSNAGKGFSQHAPLPNPERTSFRWPKAVHEGATIDLRRLGSDPRPNVTSFVIDDPIGWVVACSPTTRTLIGYAWKREHYPWFNCWRHVDDAGSPLARGLEFGTTGLHQPFDVLTAKGSIFGRPLVAFLDAGASITRSYLAFTAPLPSGWTGV